MANRRPAARTKDGRFQKGQRRKGSGYTSAREIKRNERKAEALELRLHMWSYPVIAEQMGIDVSTAHDLVAEAMAERVTPTVEIIRKEMLEQIDAMMTGVFDNAVNGDTNALAAVLALQQRKAKLTGADAPVRIERRDELDVSVSGHVDHVHTGVLRIVFVKPDGREIEGTLVPPKLTNGTGNGSNGHG